MKVDSVQSHLLCAGLHGHSCTSNVPPHKALCVAGVPLCTRCPTVSLACPWVGWGHPLDKQASPVQLKTSTGQPFPLCH